MSCVIEVLVYNLLLHCSHLTMSCVIEIQGHQDAARKLIPKEVVVISARGLNKYFVKPLKPFDELSEKEQKIASWSSRNYHHINYHSGEIKFQDLAYFLYCEGLKYEKIYTKGREKAIFLCGLLARPVEDLTDLGCPTVRHFLGPACELHSTKTAHCAERTAQYLWEWIQQQPELLCKK